MITITVSIYWFYALVIGIVLNAMINSFEYALKRKCYKLEAAKLAETVEKLKSDSLPNKEYLKLPECPHGICPTPAKCNQANKTRNALGVKEHCPLFYESLSGSK
jgi:hypothetical protein